MDRREAITMPAMAALGMLAGGGPLHGQSAGSAGPNPPAPGFGDLIAYLGEADAIAARLGYDDPALRPAYHQHVLMLLALGYVEVFGTSVAQPDWVPHIPFYLPWGSPNPDDIYRFVPIDARGRYRFRGVKGTAAVSVVTQRRGGAHIGEINGRTLAEIDLNAVEADADGRYTFLVSAERPADHRGAWYALHPDTTSLLYRSRTADATQRDPVCHIERLDLAPATAIPTPAETARRIAMLVQYARRQNEFLLGYLDRVRARGGDKGFVFDDQSGYGGLVQQKYLMHVFTLADDEALILESEVPETVRYWSVQAFDTHFSGIDHVHRQSAFNGGQVRIDADGRVRIVACATDPGVPNWLDTGGWPRGGFLWRWNNANRYPQPMVRKIKLSAVRAALPKGTPHVDAATRRAALSERADYYQSRGR